MSIPAVGGGAETTTVDPPSSGSDGSSKAPVTHHFHLPWWPEVDLGKPRAPAG